jgi:hypothetical protein
MASSTGESGLFGTDKRANGSLKAASQALARAESDLCPALIDMPAIHTHSSNVQQAARIGRQMIDEPSPARRSTVSQKECVATERLIHRSYDLNGFTLGISADEPVIAGFLDPILSPLACARPPSCDWIVSLERVATIELPQSGRRIFEGPLPEGLHSMMIESGQERAFIVPEHFAMIFRRAARTSEIRFIPGREEGLGRTAALWMLADMLAACGHALLHGALLVDPAIQQSVAVFAPSGTGKTTTVLALARSGYQLAGDDALVLSEDGNGCELWALPRKLKVGWQTAALLPWLAPVLAETWTGVEQEIELNALAPVVTLATPQPRPVKLVIVLMQPNDSAHAVTSINKPDALVRIATDNIRLFPDGIDSDNASALAALTRLVATTRVIALSVGPDPASLSRELIESV